MSEPKISKTILRTDYIESLEVENDGTRYGYGTSIKPESFGDVRLKIQENGQPHDTTEYRDV